MPPEMQDVLVYHLRQLLQTATTKSGIGWQGWVVILSLVVGLVVMTGDWVGPDFVFAGLSAFYMAARIITTNEGCSGFANSGVLTVVALYAVAEGVTQTGGLERLFSNVMGQSSSLTWAIIRMAIPCAVLAAFFNNTPIVALLIPILISWGVRRHISPKKLLIPMSYMTILGGTCTLIGTSTNLVVSGMQATRYAKTDPANATFGFFDITAVGLSYLAFGFVYILLASKWLLPGGSVSREATDLIIALRVLKTSKLIGISIPDSGLNTGVRDLKLQSVVRGGETHEAGSFTQGAGFQGVVEAGDVLIFIGAVRAASALAERLGLELLSSGGEEEFAHLSIVPNPEEVAKAFTTKRLFQVTVQPNADIVGQSLLESDLQGRFHAKVVAVKRENQVVDFAHLPSFNFEGNDNLVISTGPTFDEHDKLLKTTFTDITEISRTSELDYLIGIRVLPKSSASRKTLSELGLYGGIGVSAIAIDREGDLPIGPIDGGTQLQADDILWLSANVEGVRYLRRLYGLDPIEFPQIRKLGVSILDRVLYQVAIADHPALVGLTIRKVGFRDHYGGVVLGLSKASGGVPLPVPVADVKLNPGDVVLVDAGPDFLQKNKGEPAFSLIHQVSNSAPLKSNRMWFALAVTVVMIGLQIFSGVSGIETIHLFPAAILVAGIMLATRCMSGKDARSSINWSVYICVAFAFAVSKAMENTNVAQTIANGFKALSDAIGGETAALVLMYLATGILSEIITNNAAAALMYPIAANMGDAMGIEPMFISIAVMLGASASFIIPVGYQCNLMVYAAGNYKGLDFVKFGVPMQVVQFIAALVILSLRKIQWLVAGLSMAVVLGVIIALIAWDFIQKKRKRLQPVGSYEDLNSDDEIETNVLKKVEIARFGGK